MAIFITGATGYTGNNLAMRLANEGNKIHALCRNTAKTHLIQHPNIQVFYGDIMDIAAIEKAMAGCTQVYHLAAYARVWAKDPATFYKLNVDATKNILDAAKKLGVQKTVFTSTAGVLGPSGNRPVQENDARIGDTMNEYEDSKTEAEKLCREYCNQYGMNIVMVNPPRIYGPGVETESNAVTKLAKLYLAGKWKIMPGDGTKTGSYVYIDDVVNGHILAMQKGRSGERYILSGVNASYTEFFDTLAKVCGRKSRLYNLPVWAMMLAGRLMMLRTKITGKPPLLTPKWIRKYLYDWSLNCEKAKRELGYTYIPLEEGLQKTVGWIRQQNLR
jgi:nucleoside-diphosphate-sugar epimerase